MRRRLVASLIAPILGTLAPLHAGALGGVVRDAEGAPVAGAMVTLGHGDPLRATTVFSDEDGRFALPDPAVEGAELRVRHPGFRDQRAAAPAAGGAPLALRLERETDPLALAEQLPSNRWLALMLAQLPDPAEREEFVRQCTYCHQQGSAATRVPREDWQWEKVLTLMARMGGTLSPPLREKLPDVFRAAYDPTTAVPALLARRGEPGFAPEPDALARRARIDEWELGGRASMQHDLAVHPDGSVWTVDMMQDQLFRLDPVSGAVRSWAVPHGDLPLGGVFGGRNQPLPSNAGAHVGPHSLQVAPDGAIWTTLALGNQLGRFDPASEQWELHPLEEGFYPHTLRFDRKGRVWFTLAVSNHVARYDPATREFETIRLPAASLGQDLALRMLPALFWLSQRFDLAGAAAEGGSQVGAGTLPVPYGIDVAPDGGIWFSQLNQHKIGRIDPESLDVELVDTPFTAPRRLRFDAEGGLWIPGFSSGLVARFDLATREFRRFELPVAPRGTETPYALNVDRERGLVWICGTNSDSLIRLEIASGRFTVYPLPTRVTYTRELDFDDEGRVWTSNSNAPAWQIEGGMPRVLRLDPDAGPAVAPAVRRAAR